MKGLRRVVVGSAVGGLLGAAAFFAVDGLMPSKVSSEMIRRTGQHYTGGSSYNYGKYYDQPDWKQKPWKGTQIRDREGNSWNCPTYSSTCRPE